MVTSMRTWFTTHPFLSAVLGSITGFLLAGLVFGSSWTESLLAGFGFGLVFAALDLLERTELGWWGQLAIVGVVFFATLLTNLARGKELTHAAVGALIVTTLLTGWVLFRRGQRPPEAPLYKGSLSSHSTPLPDDSRR